MPEHTYLKGLEPLGWIHTQPSETHAMSAFDANLQGKLILDNQNWDAETAVCLTCSFTTGSCSLSLYRLTQQGLDWCKQNKENSVQVTSPNPPGYGSSLYERVQMILSDKFLGFFMIPEGGIWNYNFNGINFSQNMRYTLVLDNPKDFYNEAHRTAHFLDFGREQADDIVTVGNEGDNAADREDHFQ